MSVATLTWASTLRARPTSPPASWPSDNPGQRRPILHDLPSLIPERGCRAPARNASYSGWAANGHLTVTLGNETDFSTIEDWLLECCKLFQVRSVAYDPWAATQFAQRMMAHSIPMIEFRAATQNFSEPTKELDPPSGRIGCSTTEIRCSNGPLATSCDAMTLAPTSIDAKIDPAVALTMAVARCMASVEAESSYNNPATRTSMWL